MWLVSCGGSNCKMWLWLGLCLVSALISENTVLTIEATETETKPNIEKVLLKIWTVFENLLDSDGETVKVPSRNNIEYVLTLIKKYILENPDNQDLDYKQKLFLHEAALAKDKGVYLLDNRPLQTLLENEVIQDEHSNVMFKYELRTNNNPSCRESFNKLIQSAHEDYNNLANSPVCSDKPVVVQPSQYGLYAAGYSNENPVINSNFKIPVRANDAYDLTATGNTYLQTDDSNVATLNGQETDLNAVLQAVNISNPLGSDYTADLDHAKEVADKMNTLYQSNNGQPMEAYIHTPPLRLSKKIGSISSGVQQNMYTYLNPNPSFLQTSYVSNSQINPLNNVNQVDTLYQQVLPQGLQHSGVNQSYTLLTNTVQSHAPGFKNTLSGVGFKNALSGVGYTNPFDTFTNSKYHPNNPDHHSEIPGKQRNKKLALNLQTYPYLYTSNNNMITQNAPPNLMLSSGKKINPQPYVSKNDYLNYNIYPVSQQPNVWNNHQSYAFTRNKEGSLVSNYYPNSNQYGSLVSALRPMYAIGQEHNVVRQRPLNPQNSISTSHKLLTQNYPNTVVSQKIMQSITSHPQIANPQKLQNYVYTSKYVNSVPLQQTQNYNNNRPVIDKLANWISGTNSNKLNTNMDNEAEIELTYRVNKPPPLYHPTAFYVKFRMPYHAFTKQLNEFLKMQHLRTGQDNDLYKNLASQYNATIIPVDTADIPKEDINSAEDKILVRATYIRPNEAGNEYPKAVDIINLDNEIEQSNVNMQTPGADDSLQGMPQN